VVFLDLELQLLFLLPEIFCEALEILLQSGTSGYTFVNIKGLQTFWEGVLSESTIALIWYAGA